MKQKREAPRWKKKKKPVEKEEPHFEVSIDDIYAEVPEPKDSELSFGDLIVNVVILPFPPDRERIATSKDPFTLPEYWMGKGYRAQTGIRDDKNLEDVLNSSKFGKKMLMNRKESIE